MQFKFSKIISPILKHFVFFVDLHIEFFLNGIKKYYIYCLQPKTGMHVDCIFKNFIYLFNQFIFLVLGLKLNLALASRDRTSELYPQLNFLKF